MKYEKGDVIIFCMAVNNGDETPSGVILNVHKVSKNYTILWDKEFPPGSNNRKETHSQSYIERRWLLSKRDSRKKVLKELLG